ncbi:WEB family protein At2g38370 [Linum grandiflorum]
MGSEIGVRESPNKEEEEETSRIEVDTSAPFESVKEAVTRFGGLGYWKPSKLSASQTEMVKGEVEDMSKVEEQAEELEKDLILKERETLDVLKELEATKTIVEELKLKLQKQASEVLVLGDVAENKGHLEEEEEEDVHVNPVPEISNFPPSSTPGLILLELKQAKFNLTRTTSDLADIRSSVELLNKKLDKERASLERTRERLTTNSSKMSCLEQELSQTRLKLQGAKGVEISDGSEENNDPLDITKELQRLTSEVEQFKVMGDAARNEVSRALSEIEQTRTRIKTAEMRLVAARKMKQAARAAEAVALAEIKALSTSKVDGGVTLTFEEYSSLACKAREAEEVSKTKVVNAMVQVEEAHVSNMEVLKKVEEATEEVKTSKAALEEALSRVEAANKEKLAVEEALRKWRSENGQRKQRYVHNSTKFKNSTHSTHHRSRELSRLRDVNGTNLATDDGKDPTLKPTLSIGQILSRKLLLPEDFEMEMKAEKRKVSLGQMLSKKNVGEIQMPSVEGRKGESEEGSSSSSSVHLSGKRKKFGFARFSLMLAKQNKKKKKKHPNLNLR